MSSLRKQLEIYEINELVWARSNANDMWWPAIVIDANPSKTKYTVLYLAIKYKSQIGYKNMTPINRKFSELKQDSESKTGIINTYGQQNFSKAVNQAQSFIATLPKRTQLKGKIIISEDDADKLFDGLYTGQPEINYIEIISSTDNSNDKDINSKELDVIENQTNTSEQHITSSETVQQCTFLTKSSIFQQVAKSVVPKIEFKSPASKNLSESSVTATDNFKTNNFMCKNHPGHYREWICITCYQGNTNIKDVVTCSNCFLEKHSQHQWLKLDQFLEKVQSSNFQSNSSIESQLSKSDELIKQFQNSKTEKINQYIEKIKQLIVQETVEENKEIEKLIDEYTQKQRVCSDCSNEILSIQQGQFFRLKNISTLMNVYEGQQDQKLDNIYLQIQSNINKQTKKIDALLNFNPKKSTKNKRKNPVSDLIFEESNSTTKKQFIKF